MALFSRKPVQVAIEAPKPPVEGLQVVFHRQAADLVATGRVIVTSKQETITKKPMRFALVGTAETQVITPDILNWIWAEAETHGLKVHHLETGSWTGIVNNVDTGNTVVPFTTDRRAI